MATGPKVVVMLYRCELCGRPQAKKRRVCSRCYKEGKSIRSGICPDCGEPTASKCHTYCHVCRDARLREEGKTYREKRKLAPLFMKHAEKALSCDEYARTHEPISDEEYARKVATLRALREADVHCGDCGHKVSWHYPEPTGGNFSTLANQHMRGGAAGAGCDRSTKARSLEHRQD